MKIPEKHVFVELEDLSFDLVCFQYAMAMLRDCRQIGGLDGYLEATLEANPEIAKCGALLLQSLKVILPEFVMYEKNNVGKRLWD
ncbi:tail protein X [Bartonella alsatica]|uniref:Phage protein n=2 Tax=Bartonella alsatica TaxID=52764 RepID=J0YLD8_9HYPH|nr:tail protein X [Bartonella alsatica]EJF75388.1 hypothetical protein MEC_00864 [Bartonella alsatica IBS 382]QLC52600.1 tail protein X [Bartonella alsatica]